MIGPFSTLLFFLFVANALSLKMNNLNKNLLTNSSVGNDSKIESLSFDTMNDSISEIDAVWSIPDFIQIKLLNQALKNREDLTYLMNFETRMSALKIVKNDTYFVYQMAGPHGEIIFVQVQFCRPIDSIQQRIIAQSIKLFRTNPLKDAVLNKPTNK
ncbi:hypothetical protein MXB_3971 [Myxobolus squamalis]|nr:hypothetical protein MXB_3971 [Myxobolus squamalis]